MSYLHRLVERATGTTVAPLVTPRVAPVADPRADLVEETAFATAPDASRSYAPQIERIGEIAPVFHAPIEHHTERVIEQRVELAAPQVRELDAPRLVTPFSVTPVGSPAPATEEVPAPVVIAAPIAIAPTLAPAVTAEPAVERVAEVRTHDRIERHLETIHETAADPVPPPAVAARAPIEAPRTEVRHAPPRQLPPPRVPPPAPPVAHAPSPPRLVIGKVTVEIAAAPAAAPPRPVVVRTAKAPRTTSVRRPFGIGQE